MPQSEPPYRCSSEALAVSQGPVAMGIIRWHALSHAAVALEVREACAHAHGHKHVQTYAYQFARVVKGVDLRSTTGNFAWVRTP